MNSSKSNKIEEEIEKYIEILRNIIKEKEVGKESTEIISNDFLNNKEKE